MNLVDSSGWLEYFTDGKNAGFFASAVEDTEQLVVSAINIYEVFRKLLREKDESAALHAVAAMRQGRVIPVDEVIALEGARICSETGLPMADGLIMATARSCKAILLTQDSDFNGMDNVRYISAKK
ncbi:MAG: type II toxin-antitoxin system VapC family toxin [Spirochaetes bacterium]|nr:type II toxin-antitoxin system VapC family toxin [Spirochaetota bacterium]